MSQAYNVYCDESCHLENDHQKAMVLGAVWCPTEKSHHISTRLREIKVKHNLPPDFELKWTKVSPAKIDYYLEALDYFFDDDNLHFRALIVPDKSLLRHEEHGQDHETWYYKMYFDMLKVLLSPQDKYRIYVDVKDTRGGRKVNKLQDVLCNNMYDFSREIIERVQLVRSHEVEMIQLADLLIGIISYVNRGLETSKAKVELIRRMRDRSGYDLTKTTLLRENKVNLLRWQASESE
jgi:hypothetical protein